ncbi:alpha/beta hydrolase [Anaerovibrio sp. JC8]|uniref:alpha/beta hydrolase n=1 Tax=Anaerovibrio sp. JC8 TaxID=1240085 RepID=UPI001E45845C|nr:alpha/beta hydrolase-fold protein [Anaerovibrio sp. JC8]
METEGKRVYVYGGEEKGAPLVVVNTFQGDGREIYGAATEMTDSSFTLAVVGDIDWNHEMAPWESPPVFKGESAFTAGAEEYLNKLTNSIIPAIKQEHSLDPEYLVIAGYSLAGLFALYSLYRTDVFARAVSASGSLWFPGFEDFSNENAFLKMPDKVYFSLGDKEKNTKNKLLGQVEDRTRNIYNSYKENGIDTVFELNPGNHFQKPDWRLAKGIVWILQRN